MNIILSLREKKMNDQGLMHLRPSSEDISNLLFLDIEGLSETISDNTQFGYPFHKFFPERVVFPPVIQKSMVCQRLRSNESAYPSMFQSNIYIEASKQNYLASSFKGNYSIVIHYQGHISFEESTDPIAIWTEGPPDETWTVQSWVVDAVELEITHDNEINNLRGELNDLLSGFNNGIPLLRPAELLQMAERVANQIEQRKEDDIDNWAEELSKDLSKLSD